MNENNEFIQLGMRNDELNNEFNGLNGFTCREGVIVNHTAGYSDKM